MRTISAIIATFLAGLLLQRSLTGKVWEELTPMPEGRSGMIAFLTEQGEPAYYGGSSWYLEKKQIHRSGYRLVGDTWLPLPPLDQPVAYAAVAQSDNVLYVAGGTDGSGVHPILWSMNLRQKLVADQVAVLPGRIYAGAAWIKGVFYQFGGSPQLSPLNPDAAVERYEESAWTKVTELPEGPLINAAAATWKDSFIILGGGIPATGGMKNTESVYAFDPRKISWTRRASLPAAARGIAAVAVAEQGVLVVGGYLDSSEFSAQVLLFDPDQNKFEALPNMPLGLMLPAVVLNGDWIYVFGGEDAPKHRSSHVFRTSLTALLEKDEE